MALKTVIVNNYTKSSSSNHLECRVCKQRFYTTGNLIDHMSTHKHFLLHCNICNKGFSDQKNLDEHYLTHKEVTNTFDCSQCGKKFLQKHQLEYHMQFHAILTPVTRTVSPKKKPLSFTSFQDSSDSEYNAFDADTSEDYKPPTKKVKKTQHAQRGKTKNAYMDEDVSESEEFASDDSRYDYMLPKQTKSGRTVKRKKFFDCEPKTKRKGKKPGKHLDACGNDTVPGFYKTPGKQTVKKFGKALNAKPSPTILEDSEASTDTLFEKKKIDKIAHKNYLLSKKQAKSKCIEFTDDDSSAENERTLIGFKKKTDYGDRTKRKYNKKSNEKVETLSAKHLKIPLHSKVKRKAINEAFSRYTLKLQQSSNCDQGEGPNTPEPANSSQLYQNYNLKTLSVVLEKIPESVYSKYAEKLNAKSNYINLKQTASQNKTFAASLKEKTDLSKYISNQSKMPVNSSLINYQNSSTHDKTPIVKFNIFTDSNLKDSQKLNIVSSKNSACISKTNGMKNNINNYQVVNPEKSDQAHNLFSNTKTVPVNTLVNAKTVPVNILVNAKTVPVSKPASPKNVHVGKPVCAKTVMGNKPVILNQTLSPDPQIKVSKHELKKSTPASTTHIAVNVVNPSGNEREFLYVGPEQDYNKITSAINEMESMNSNKNTAGTLTSKNLQNAKNVQKGNSSTIVYPTNGNSLSNDKHADISPQIEEGVIEKKFIKDFVFVKVTREYMEKIQQEKSDLLIKRNSVTPSVSNISQSVQLANHSANLTQLKPVKEILPSKLTEKVTEQNITSITLSSQSVRTDFGSINPSITNTSSKANEAESSKNCKTGETNKKTNSEIKESLIQDKTQPKKIEFDKAESIGLVDKSGDSVTHFFKMMSTEKEIIDKSNKTTIINSSKILPETSKISVKSEAISTNLQVKKNSENSSSEPSKITIINLDTGVEQSLEQAMTEIKNAEKATERKNNEFKHVIIDRAKALCLKNKMVISDSPKSNNSPKSKKGTALSPKVFEADNSSNPKVSNSCEAASSLLNKSNLKNTEAKLKESPNSTFGPKLSKKVSTTHNSDETVENSIETNINLKKSENVCTKQVKCVNSETNEEPTDNHEKNFKTLQGEKDAKMESGTSQIVSPTLSEKVLQRYKEKIEEKERKKREKYELKKKLRTEEKFSTNSPDKNCHAEEQTKKLTSNKDKKRSSESEEACTVHENNNRKQSSESNQSQLPIDVYQSSVKENVENSSSLTRNKALPNEDSLKACTSDDVARQQGKITYAIRFTPKSQAQHEKLKSKSCKSPDEEAIEKAYNISLKFQKSLSEKECLKLLDELDSLITNFNISKKCPFLFTIIRFCRLYMDSYEVKEQAISLHTKLTKNLL